MYVKQWMHVTSCVKLFYIDDDDGNNNITNNDYDDGTQLKFGKS